MKMHLVKSGVVMGIVGLMICIGGCASRPLSVKRTDAQLNTILTTGFRTGMSEAEVRAELDKMGVSSEDRIEYPPENGRPRVLLARNFEGGFWLNEEDQTVDWVDLSFVLDESRHLTQLLYFRDSIRYFQGGPAYGPRRPPMRPVQNYPIKPAPPADPLQDAVLVDLGR